MGKQQTATKLARPNPKDFLRARRPEQFSDSIKLHESAIDRSMLEYHFESLNNRSQELQFETFVRKLCEREICPNLVPQTGPTAGGDGKTDTETYPVANQIAFFWGLNDAPEAERWAFGVSTQRAWKAKCVKDVESIMSTGRGYVQIFCVSSRYIKNSSRVELQDELSKKHGVKVTILDRTWLLDKTLQPKNQHLAIDHLGLTGNFESKVQLGPFDADKQIQLADIERQIDQIEDPGHLTIPQVDLYTNRAIIYKELERDAYAVRQQFDIAVRTAKKFGTPRQHFDAIYELAWAAYWWLEDADLFEANIEKALSVAEETDNVEVWEKIVTLFSLAVTSHREGTCTLDVVSLEDNIRTKLNALASDADMISGALQAKTSLALLDLLRAESEEKVTNTFRSLTLIADSAKKLIGYPMARLINLLEELDVAFGDFEAYEDLVDKVIDDASAREGSRLVADKYLRRGAVSLDKRDYYRAIKCLGLSLYGLYNNKSKTEIFSALYMLSHAYEKQGLLWAARGAALMAAHLVTADALKEQRSSSKQVAIYHRLMWIDAQLGHLSQSLHWYSLSHLIAPMLAEDRWTDDQRISYECLIGQLFLNAKFSDIEKIAWLPDGLNQMGLPLCADALLVCLGHEDKAGPESESIDFDFINMWRSIDLGGSPIAPLDLYSERWTTIDSHILGCKVSVTFPIKPPCIELAQQLLAVLESFCAPMMADHAVATVPSVNIDISLEDEDDMVLQHAFDMGAQVTSAQILCSAFDIAKLDNDQRAIIQQFYTEFCLHFVSVICPQIGWSKLEEMLRDDKALERAVIFNCNLGLEGLMMGYDAVPGIASHRKQSFELYEPTRKVTWFEHHKIEKVDWHLKTGVGEERPKHPFQLEALKHRELKVTSLIQASLWDQARWKAMGFQTCDGEIPVLMFGFEQAAVGDKIFSNMARTLGDKDPANTLRIALIRGISKQNPTHYRVVVTNNIDVTEADSTKIQTSLSRINTMTPESTVNLERFFKDYEICKKCHIATVNAQGKLVTHLLTSGVVTKYAWEIDENDQEISAIRLDDDVFIPEGMANPPISRALAKIRSLSKR
ncbi:hypothetical protein [Azomonas macrocytogenes]|uniref:Tetratricopeptide (TPR) repeat protein n=1 Tax=Azomonas macrocytogenes TaxID=69962 RepID=A0A839T7L8_AZOMA|nr:hypothetical protein [Azomonas macrocytogenes]MBB3105078.1 tetratricopeptide (TPR) repeat protein [Azomonas macrocytogenes]